MPRLVRMYIHCCLIGFGAAAVFTGLVLWSDLGGIGGLVARSDVGLMAITVFWLFNGIVFSGVQTVWTLMQMARDP